MWVRARSGPDRCRDRRKGCNGRSCGSLTSLREADRILPKRRLHTPSTKARSGRETGSRAGQPGRPVRQRWKPVWVRATRCSPSHSARLAHRIDHSLSQLLEAKPFDLGSETDQVRPAWQIRERLGSDRTKPAAPAVSHHGASDLSPYSVSHASSTGAHAIYVCLRKKVYRHWSASSPTWAAKKRPEGVSARDGRRAAGQADRRNLPRLRRALMIVWPARVDMRWRKPCRLARFLVFGWYVRFMTPL